jgi:hypothetical protein
LYFSDVRLQMVPIIWIKHNATLAYTIFSMKIIFKRNSTHICSFLPKYKQLLVGNWTFLPKAVDLVWWSLHEHFYESRIISKKKVGIVLVLKRYFQQFELRFIIDLSFGGMSSTVDRESISGLPFTFLSKSIQREPNYWIPTVILDVYKHISLKQSLCQRNIFMFWYSSFDA